MSVPVSAPLIGDTKQEKTKAKTRYLKRKKQRRKQKKAGANHPNRPALVNEEDKYAEDEDSSSEETDEEPTLDEISNEQSSYEEKRILERGVLDSDVDAERPSRPTHIESRGSSPSMTASAFPSFPLPIAPDAPSKSSLSLQGLDSALLAAELIDPLRTVSVDALNAEYSSKSNALPVISEKMKKRLSEIGILELFAVQTALLPFLLPSARRSRALYCPYDPPRDVCVSAPTGSGKTLAYVIPIVEILSSRIATRLRALVVLPTRDLVLQVQETFEALSKGRGLKIGVATGQHSFSHEQSQLVYDATGLQGGTSKVDILVCTPGRLIDHLNGTPGFTLQHLRFLVIDEADRLLAQSFQDWLAQVLSALQTNLQKEEDTISRFDGPLLDLSSRYPLVPDKPSSKTQLLSLPHHDAFAPLFVPCVNTSFDDQKRVSCQKLLFSATLTRDPSRIAALGLRDPKYFVVQSAPSIDRVADGANVAAATLGAEEFAMPSGLSEHYITTSPERKPLIMFHLVHKLGISNALVFTKSASSTARLVKLFEFFEEAYNEAMDVDDSTTKRRVVAQSYSSDLPPSERRTILERFKKKEIDILVCSDLVARGLDIPHVTHVVSYDAPIDLRKYIHRAGRTARAGRTGDAWTLVEEQEARHFKQMMRNAGGSENEKGRLDSIKRLRVNSSDLSGMEPCYDIALERLKEAYSRNLS